MDDRFEIGKFLYDKSRRQLTAMLEDLGEDYFPGKQITVFNPMTKGEVTFQYVETRIDQITQDTLYWKYKSDDLYLMILNDGL